MPGCDLVVTHGGHGTLVRALACGCPVVVCPAGGDMGENAARADWAGVGVRLPRRLLGRAHAAAGRRAGAADAGDADRARAVAAWIAGHDGADAAARELEALGGVGLGGAGRAARRRRRAPTSACPACGPDLAALDELEALGVVARDMARRRAGALDVDLHADLEAEVDDAGDLAARAPSSGVGPRS